jgi:hypothetical protein
MPQANELSVLQRIQTEMGRHLLEHDAPEEVWDFLQRHWARLLTGIFVSKGNQHADWLAGWDTVNALLVESGAEDIAQRNRTHAAYVADVAGAFA